MDIKLYNDLMKKQHDAMTPEMCDAIIEQTRLHDIVIKKRSALYVLNDKSIKLLQIGTEKFLAAYPQFKKFFSCSDLKVDIIKHACELATNNTVDFKEITSKMKDIPELRENSTLIDDIGKACYEYIVAFEALEKKISDGRKKLFSPQYNDKIDKLADSGTFLYFLETPDLPLLEEACDENFILESFALNECMNLKILLSQLFCCDDAISPSMQRKSEDIYITVELINNGFYRAAIRNLFALLDSEHKKGATAFDGIAYKVKKLKKGHQRAKRISELVDRLGDEWMQRAWLKVNDYFKNITSTQPILNVPHRNSIVHGDYNSDLIDVNQYDAIKILLLWLNMRLIVDYFCNLDELYDFFLQNLPTIVTKLIGSAS
ncbi:MAG: hypothetical protein K2N34_14825 [Lachnospiraceae bacterium]|nr:hypothetical protein [Lachnospiraceae bacterium]